MRGRTAGVRAPQRPVPTAVACVVLAFLVLPLLAAPAAAVGPTVDLTVQPPRSIGTPSQGSPGAVDLSADATVFGASSSAGTLVFTVTNNLGWEAQPASQSVAVPSGGGQFSFEFQIMVPEDEDAGATTGVEVRAEYRVGPATLATAVAGASVEAGNYYGGSVSRISAPGPMSPGTTYLIEYDVLNEGNAGSVMTFTWTDPGLISRLKADFETPTTLPVAGHENRTAEFRITPQGTTPDGTYQVPVQMVITDRTGVAFGHVNFTIEMEFDNLPIYPGILPRFDLTGVNTILGWVGVIFVLWLLMNAAIAFVKRHDFDKDDGSIFIQAYSERLSNTLVYRGAARALGRARGSKKRKRARRLEEA